MQSHNGLIFMATELGNLEKRWRVSLITSRIKYLYLFIILIEIFIQRKMLKILYIFFSLYKRHDIVYIFFFFFWKMLKSKSKLRNLWNYGYLICRLRGLSCPLLRVVRFNKTLRLVKMSQKRLKLPPRPSFSLQDLRQVHEQNPLIDRTQELIIPMSLRPIKEVCPLGRFVTFPRPCARAVARINDSRFLERYICIIRDEIIISHKFHRR